MPKASIRFAKSAAEDLEAIRSWYEEQDAAHIGARLVTEIFVRVQALSDNPEMGRIVPEFQQRFLRELIYPPFRIVYRRDPGFVRIVRVWRSERLLKLPDE